jgi:hypothetical protein
VVLAACEDRLKGYTMSSWSPSMADPATSSTLIMSMQACMTSAGRVCERKFTQAGSAQTQPREGIHLPNQASQCHLWCQEH